MISRFFVALAMMLFMQSASFAGCKPLNHAGQPYTVCTFDPRTEYIETFNLDATGAPLNTFSALQEELATEGKTLTFAMNAGMFGTDYKPIGLYIENGKQARKLNRRGGYGNFHLKPNGVFYVDRAKAGVVDSDTYAKLGLKPQHASQSGPMLVINGKIHPKFSTTGISAKIRNGVGVQDDGKVVFALAEVPVNFHAFASLFKDALGCRNALFLDGTISGLFSTDLGRNDLFLPLGPMVGVFEMK